MDHAVPATVLVDSNAPERPTHLRCEGLEDPLGLDQPAPDFSWQVTTARPGAAQTAYQILVATTRESLAAEVGDLWDSGRVASPQSARVLYAGAPLVSRQTGFWQVRLWDERGQVSAYSAVARFRMGLLQPEDWIAGWFGFPASEAGRALDFRVTFDLAEPPREARLYITGLGYYEAFVNGTRLGDAVLEPANSDPLKRVYHQVHDVTGLLGAGANVLAASVGAGWYGMPKLLAQLEVREGAGWRTVLATARRPGLPHWSVAGSATVASSVFDGEHHDARLERVGWTGVAYDPEQETDRFHKWKQVCQVAGPGGRLQHQAIEPIRRIRPLSAVAIRPVQPGIYVLDFGQNHAGWCELQVQGQAGETITLRYAETLNADGSVNQENLRSARATDRYTLRGGGVERWHPRFTYHGYRYVQVEGWPGTPTAEAVVAWVVRSDVASRGTFDCSDPLLARIHTMVRWTEESNLHGIPTDCPQRDERMGWLNDMTVRADELIYNFACDRFLEKFVDDIADTQDPGDGAIGDTAPFHWGYRPADPISVCYLLMPYLLDQQGESGAVLERHYPGFCRWARYLRSQAQGGVLAYSHYGDWAPPIAQTPQLGAYAPPLSKDTPGALVSTAYFFYTVRTLAAIAERLGFAADARALRAEARTIADAFHAAFWNPAVGGYGSGNQACNSLALYLELVPGDLRSGVLAALVANVQAHDHHVTTGNLCTKYLLEVLAGAGHFETAYRLATQRTYPSWGFMLASGATTVWERWEPLRGDGMNSHNHPMFGAIGAWLYRWVAGIEITRDAQGAGHVVVRVPETDRLDHASATLQTAWGQAACAWRRQAASLEVVIEIPWNCRGTLTVRGTAHPLNAGRHVLRF